MTRNVTVAILVAVVVGALFLGLTKPGHRALNSLGELWSKLGEGMKE